MRSMIFIPFILLPTASASARMSGDVAFASSVDLAGAARCSVTKAIVDGRTAGFRIKSGGGTLVFTTQRVKGSKISGEMTLPFDAIEIPLAGERTSSSTETVTQTVSLDVDPQVKKIPPACEKLTIRSIDKRGLPLPVASPYLFTFQDMQGAFGAKMGFLSKTTIGQEFARQTKASSGFKLNLFGLLKIGYDKNALQNSRKSGYTVTIEFEPSSANVLGNPYPKKKAPSLSPP